MRLKNANHQKGEAMDSRLLAIADGFGVKPCCGSPLVVGQQIIVPKNLEQRTKEVLIGRGPALPAPQLAGARPSSLGSGFLGGVRAMAPCGRSSLPPCPTK